MVEEKKQSCSQSTMVDKIVVPGDVVLDLSKLSNQTIKLGDGLRQDCDSITVMKSGKLRFSKPNKYWVESSQKRVPGDVVLDLSKLSNQTIKLGDGLRQDCDSITVMKSGKLRFSKPNKYWVESSQKRYVPCVDDTVLGIVLDSKADNFLVDIKGPAVAFLPVLAFEGGTRRNIPKFEPGSLIYVRVVKANMGMNPELSCTDVNGKAAEFGALKDGYMFETSTGLSRTLLSSPTCPVLEALGKKQLSFEIAVGLNGRVWVNAESPSKVILLANALMKSEPLTAVQQRIMVESLLQRVQ